ncbi:MAG: pentapeptide repeat-containing protein, partial [Gammaproteobacteria bacterium]|nr:pentapeptide repeat-containing protein [Gammaproteobacteria bacterium]
MMSENRTIAKWLSGVVEAATSFLAEFCKKRISRALLLWAYLLFVLPIGLVLPADHGRNIILILGGTAAGFIAVWRALVADKQNKINEQSQITERFTRAVDQLGSESIYMRIGALHALERIGRDSENDVVAILRLLSSFVRNQSRPRKIDKVSLAGDGLRTPLDVAEGFAVIYRLAREYDQLLRDEGKGVVNLSSSNLNDLSQFSKGCFLRFGFDSCDLRSGSFPGSNFGGADFDSACLKNAYLPSCNFHGASFTYAILDRADFNGADMAQASLAGAFCNGTDFSTAENLTTDMLKGIIYDKETPPRVPKGVTLPPPRKKPS